jgi:uncharacterized protein (DUF488 family)
MDRLRIYTIGHSTRTADALAGMLLESQIDLLVDIRRYPHSRRNPQFEREALERSIPARGLRYEHAEDLGGMREPRADSPNTGIKDEALRGYADYTATAEFARAAGRVLAEARTARVALMCAEANPRECHRRILSDWLVAQGHEVVHLIGPDRVELHAPFPGLVRDERGTLVWPPRQKRLFD